MSEFPEDVLVVGDDNIVLVSLLAVLASRSSDVKAVSRKKDLVVTFEGIDDEMRDRFVTATRKIREYRRKHGQEAI